MDIHLHIGQLVIDLPAEKIDKILDLVINNSKKQEQIMATLKDIQDQNTALIAAVQAEDTVIDSAVTLIGGFSTTLAGIKQQLADALASNDPVAQQAVVDSLTSTIADVSAKKDALAAAVAANTPAA